MAVIDSDSAILYTGSVKAVRGQEYANISGSGNSLIPSEDIGISINRGPLVMIKAYQPFLVSATFTYSFDRDSTFLTGNFVVPDYYVVNVAYSADDVILVADVESASIVSTFDPKSITKGELSALAYVDSTSNQPESVIIRLYGTSAGLLHTTTPISITANSRGVNCLAHTEINDPTVLLADEVVYFTVEGSSSSLAVRASDTASQIRLTRKNL